MTQDVAHELKRDYDTQVSSTDIATAQEHKYMDDRVGNIEKAVVAMQAMSHQLALAMVTLLILLLIRRRAGSAQALLIFEGRRICAATT